MTTDSPRDSSKVEADSPRPSSEVAVGRPGAKSQVEVRVRDILSRLQTSTTPEGTIITLPERVLFDFDQAELRAEAAPTLAQVADVVRFYEDAPVSIRGHTDDVGNEAYNDDLSRRRAEVVAAKLEDHTASTRPENASRWHPTPFPTAPTNPEGRAKNRRVEIVIGGVRPPEG